MFITGNSSILLNVLAWISLWCLISFGLTFVYISLIEISRFLNRRHLKKFDKKFDTLNKEYNDDLV